MFVSHIALVEGVDAGSTVSNSPSAMAYQVPVA